MSAVPARQGADEGQPVVAVSGAAAGPDRYPMTAAARVRWNAAVEAELRRAPPLTADRVRRILEASGVRVKPAPTRSPPDPRPTDDRSPWPA